MNSKVFVYFALFAVTSEIRGYLCPSVVSLDFQFSSIEIISMIELEQALRQILDCVPTLPAKSASLNAAANCILAEEIVSSIDLPPFDNSAMDGYAVCSADLISATQHQKIPLKLAGKIAAGENFSGKIEPGQCVRIFTGSPLPSGADSVAMQEDTEVDPQNPETILFLDSLKPWENIRFRGEDVKSGSVLLKAGTPLSAGQLTLLGAIGKETVRVGSQPIVGLLATGSELREPGQTLAPGQIFESNRIGLAALTKKTGAVPKIFPLVSDTLDATKAALESAFSECDIVVTTGGVSVGELDFVKTAFKELGGKIEFWKIAVKPGKPFVFGRLGEKFLFGLPGNPVSAFVTFLLLVAPALKKLQGATDFNWPKHPGVLAQTLENRAPRRHFVRVIVDGNSNVRSAGTQASHVLSSLAAANGLVEIPPGAVLEKGSTVSVLRWEC